MPNIPIPALHTYASDGTMEEVSGGTLFRGDALGSWEHLRDQEYAARYKFFIFNLSGRRASGAAHLKRQFRGGGLHRQRVKITCALCGIGCKPRHLRRCRGFPLAQTCRGLPLGRTLSRHQSLP